MPLETESKAGLLHDVTPTERDTIRKDFGKKENTEVGALLDLLLLRGHVCARWRCDGGECIEFRGLKLILKAKQRI